MGPSAPQDSMQAAQQASLARRYVAEPHQQTRVGYEWVVL